MDLKYIVPWSTGFYQVFCFCKNNQLIWKDKAVKVFSALLNIPACDLGNVIAMGQKQKHTNNHDPLQNRTIMPLCSWRQCVKLWGQSLLWSDSDLLWQISLSQIPGWKFVCAAETFHKTVGKSKPANIQFICSALLECTCKGWNGAILKLIVEMFKQTGYVLYVVPFVVSLALQSTKLLGQCKLLPSPNNLIA